ncbi:prepilin-type N-terminal cleavage/methylation domain-containing protein [Allofournierella sp.]|uniref:prepilin-type N-terminal cleavage/methylation domain-containing protein n=1 Tax=Allofournierella sp. TaxID=1940256 RepID=UPI003AB8DDD8
MERKAGAKPGFTLVEVIVVIVMMSILAAAGLVGFGGMVSHFNEQACMASRREAAQAFISEWLEGDLPDALSLTFDGEGWLDGYAAENDVKDADNWGCRVYPAADRKTARILIWCNRHRDLTEEHDQGGGFYTFGGDVWMEFEVPELVG